MGIALAGIVAASAGDMVDMVDMVVSVSESKGGLDGKQTFCCSEAGKETDGDGNDWKQHKCCRRYLG